MHGWWMRKVNWVESAMAVSCLGFPAGVWLYSAFNKVKYRLDGLSYVLFESHGCNPNICRCLFA